MKEKIKKLGGKIHKTLNNTRHRKLTLKEYSKLVENIQKMVELERESTMLMCAKATKDLIANDK